MLDLMNRIHPEPELDGFVPRLSHGPKPVIPGTVAACPREYRCRCGAAVGSVDSICPDCLDAAMDEQRWGNGRTDPLDVTGPSDATGGLPPAAPHEMEFSADDGYAGPVRDPSPAPEDRDGGSYARALRIELNAALVREGGLATDNARLRGERDELARELSRRAMARAAV